MTFIVYVSRIKNNGEVNEEPLYLSKHGSLIGELNNKWYNTNNSPNPDSNRSLGPPKNRGLGDLDRITKLRRKTVTNNFRFIKKCLAKLQYLTLTTYDEGGKNKSNMIFLSLFTK